MYIEVDAGLLQRFDSSACDVLALLRDAGYRGWRNETHENEPYRWRL